jgi:hypothetical protein
MFHSLSFFLVVLEFLVVDSWLAVGPLLLGAATGALLTRIQLTCTARNHFVVKDAG